VRARRRPSGRGGPLGSVGIGICVCLPVRRSRHPNGCKREYRESKYCFHIQSPLSFLIDSTNLIDEIRNGKDSTEITDPN